MYFVGLIDRCGKRKEQRLDYTGQAGIKKGFKIIFGWPVISHNNNPVIIKGNCIFFFQVFFPSIDGKYFLSQQMYKVKKLFISCTVHYIFCSRLSIRTSTFISQKRQKGCSYFH